MISLKNKSSRGFTRTNSKKSLGGFTIVELLIVIIIIGILAALVIVTYRGIQQKARDTERKTDINALHGQLEAYSAETGKYPTLANVNNATFRAANLKGLDPAALQDPKGTGRHSPVCQKRAAAGQRISAVQLFSADSRTDDDCWRRNRQDRSDTTEGG